LTVLSQWTNSHFTRARTFTQKTLPFVGFFIFVKIFILGLGSFNWDSVIGVTHCIRGYRGKGGVTEKQQALFSIFTGKKNELLRPVGG
jgi:hypothetical protein